MTRRKLDTQNPNHLFYQDPQTTQPWEKIGVTRSAWEWHKRVWIEYGLSEEPTQYRHGPNAWDFDPTVTPTTDEVAETARLIKAKTDQLIGHRMVNYLI